MRASHQRTPGSLPIHAMPACMASQTHSSRKIHSAAKTVNAPRTTAAGRLLRFPFMRADAAGSLSRPDRAPEPVGRRRHIEVRDARLAKGVQYRVHKRGERAAHARFAHAFRAERVRGGRDRVLVDREACNEPRARHRVVHEAPGEELAGVGIVYGMLAENLPRPLRDPALHLAFDEHAVYDRSEEHTSELQSLTNLVCRLLLEKKKNTH